MELQKCWKKTSDELNKLLELRPQKYFELHVEQASKKGIILINDYSLSNLGTLKNEILEELKSEKYNDVANMVYRVQITYDEVMDIIKLNYFPSKKQGIPYNQV